MREPSRFQRLPTFSPFSYIRRLWHRRRGVARGWRGRGRGRKPENLDRLRIARCSVMAGTRRRQWRCRTGSTPWAHKLPDHADYRNSWNIASHMRDLRGKGLAGILVISGISGKTREWKTSEACLWKSLLDCDHRTSICLPDSSLRRSERINFVKINGSTFDRMGEQLHANQNWEDNISSLRQPNVCSTDESIVALYPHRDISQDFSRCRA